MATKKLAEVLAGSYWREVSLSDGFAAILSPPTRFIRSPFYPGNFNTAAQGKDSSFFRTGIPQSVGSIPNSYHSWITQQTFTSDKFNVWFYNPKEGKMFEQEIIGEWCYKLGIVYHNGEGG